MITYEEIFEDEVVDIDPDWTSPVVLPCLKKFVFLTQTSDTKVTP